MSFFELVLSVRGFDLPAASREIAALSALPWEELERWSRDRRDEIANHHFTNNPLYRAKTGQAFPPHWDELPIMVKRDFQVGLSSTVTPALKNHRLYRASTSGSSGTPLMFAKDLHSHACCWALIKQRYDWHGLTLSSKQARFFGTPLEGRSKWQERSKDFTMNRRRFVVFDLSDERLAEFTETFRRNRFEYAYGFTSSLVVFGRYLQKRGLTLKSVCPTLKLCMVTSEVCTAEDRRLLTAAFDVPVVNEYGASEVGIIAFDSPAGDWLLSDETLFVEAVDEAGAAVPDGTVGRLLVTDLRNRAWPCIRYEIGDMGAIRTRVDSGGQARRVLERLEGRVGDSIILPSGRKTAAFTFYYVTRSLLETWEIFRELQIRQTAPDEFVFDIVSDQPLTSEHEGEIPPARGALLRAWPAGAHQPRAGHPGIGVGQAPPLPAVPA